jgi:threonine/homoserine/homoserine lactone efflux protein
VSLEFLITSFIVVASPGTGALFTVASGLSRGERAGLIAAFGCTLGIVPHMLATILGLAALFQASPVAFDILKYLGVAYLLYMARGTLKQHGVFDPEIQIAAESPLRTIIYAVLINLLNPKLPIFFLAFLPQFIRPGEASPAGHLLELSGMFMLITLVVFTGYGVFAAFMRNHVLARPRVLTWMRRSFAAGFLALGVKLVISQR